MRAHVELLHHVVGVEPVVGQQEALEAGHVAVLAVPGDEDRGGGHVPDVEAADGGERTELGILDGEKMSVQQTLRGGALRSHPAPPPGLVQPLPVLAEPQLLLERLAGADERIVWTERKQNINTEVLAQLSEDLFSIFSPPSKHSFYSV